MGCVNIGGTVDDIHDPQAVDLNIGVGGVGIGAEVYWGEAFSEPNGNFSFSHTYNLSGALGLGFFSSRLDDGYFASIDPMVSGFVAGFGVSGSEMFGVGIPLKG